MRRWQKVVKFLDKRFSRARGVTGADWGSCYVWSVKSDGCTEGRFIYMTDDNDFILLDRSEENEETKTNQLFVYCIGSGELHKILNYENNRTK